VHVGHLVHSFAQDNMYEFEIDCLILTITCDILILTERGNYLKFSSLPVQVVHVVAVPLMKKTEKGRGILILTA
jgi:hypothetical protein